MRVCRLARGASSGRDGSCGEAGGTVPAPLRATLAAKVRSGGKGVWGPMAMPPTDAKKISDADLDAVIAWILKQ